ncbi:hypothetical protein BDZ91DRAFT_53113 [Kalaharituber pfeilii]|nr:hypothetical protein BDZ91DRAFT_53113 [Kalaharituber pfeilii]
MNPKQTRFHEGPPLSAPPARPRRSSVSHSRIPEGGRPYAPPQVDIEVNTSYKTSSGRVRAYHSHSRDSSGEYTTRPLPRGQPAGAPCSNDNDGIRVYPTLLDPVSQPPLVDPFSLPRTVPIRIPTDNRPPPLQTSFHNATPPMPTPSRSQHLFGGSPHNGPAPPPPTFAESMLHAFDNMRLGTDPRSSRDTFHSFSTDTSGEHSTGTRSHRRNSFREADTQFAGNPSPRDGPVYRDEHLGGHGRPHHQRRKSSSAYYFGSNRISTHHSRNTSEDVFPPAEDLPKRRSSVRGNEERYPFTRSQGNVTIHQNTYDSGAMGNVPADRGYHAGRREREPEASVWIAVMGVTGSGKSTFIQTATGHKAVGVNHGLQSCTKEVQVHPFMLNGYRVNLIDTPGFDDNNRSEISVLQTISAYLAKAYYNRIYLNGIIYLHGITQTRSGGSGVRSLGILQRLIGEDNMHNVMLVSSMWDALSDTINKYGQKLTAQEVGELRESDLCNQSELWKNFIEQGAQVGRHYGGKTRSAHHIISRFLNPVANNGFGRPMRLLLQYELVDQKKRLEETAVGSYINDKLYEGQKLLQQEIQDLKRKYQRAKDRNGGSSGTPSEIEQLLDEKVKGLAEIRKKAEILGRDVNELVDEEGNNVTGRTSGSHAGLCTVM